jgi:hypothetical protein
MASNFSEKFYDRYKSETPTHYFSVKKFQESINQYASINNSNYFNFIDIAKYKLDVKSIYFKYNKKNYARNTKIFENYIFYKKKKCLINEKLFYIIKKKIKTSDFDYENFYKTNGFGF